MAHWNRLFAQLETSIYVGFTIATFDYQRVIAWYSMIFHDIIWRLWTHRIRNSDIHRDIALHHIKNPLCFCFYHHFWWTSPCFCRSFWHISLGFLHLRWCHRQLWCHGCPASFTSVGGSQGRFASGWAGRFSPEQLEVLSHPKIFSGWYLLVF